MSARLISSSEERRQPASSPQPRLPSPLHSNTEAVSMRVWSLHPTYLDQQGLCGLWRETLLCQKVLAGGTKGKCVCVADSPISPCPAMTLHGERGRQGYLAMAHYYSSPPAALHTSTHTPSPYPHPSALPSIPQHTRLHQAPATGPLASLCSAPGRHRHVPLHRLPGGAEPWV